MRLRTELARGPIVLVAVALAWAVEAQQPDRSRDAWDGVYTEAQADRGKAAYAVACDRCHAIGPEGSPRRFTGERFWAAWGEDTLATLFTTMRRTMPNDSPGSLPDATYTDIVAFLLKSNGVPAGATELTTGAIPSTRLSARLGEGTIPEGAFVAVTGCLAKADEGWILRRASPPRRARSGMPEATPLGTGLLPLRYVITSLDKLQGRAVVVSGLLLREPSEAINVIAVEGVESSCE